MGATDFAPKTLVTVNNLDGLTESQTIILDRNSKHGKLELFSLPGGNICVPLLDEETEDSGAQFTHVMNGKVIIS